MNLIEITRRSWGVYRKNFPILVIPLLALALVVLVAFSSIETGGVIPYRENKTDVVIGAVHSGTPDLLDEGDENYFEVGAVEAGGMYELEMRNDSQAMPPAEIAGDWIGVGLIFRSENSATYHLEIYNFKTASWEPLRSENVGATWVAWENIKTDTAGYIHDTENYMKVRLYTSGEENAHRLQVDLLVYAVLRLPDMAKVWTVELGFLLGIIFCFGIAVVAAHGAMSKSPAGFRGVIKIAGRKYLGMLAVGAIPGVSLFLLLHFILTPWGVFLLLPVLLFIFSCAYVLQEAVIRSSGPLRSIKRSFGLAWGNIGVTFVLWGLFALVWFFFNQLPIVGVFALWLFLPLWMVMLSVTYMDRTGELLKLEKPEEGTQ